VREYGVKAPELVRDAVGKAPPCAYTAFGGEGTAGMWAFLLLILILLMILIRPAGELRCAVPLRARLRLHPLRRAAGRLRFDPEPKPRKYRSRVLRLDRKMLIMNW